MLIVEIIVEKRPLRNQGLQQVREHSAAFQASLQGVDTRQLRGSVQRSEKDLLRSLRSLAQQGRLFPAGLRGIHDGGDRMSQTLGDTLTRAPREKTTTSRTS